MNTLAYEQGLKRAAMRRPAAPSLGDVWYTQPSRGVETSTLQFGEFQRVAVVTANAASVPGKGGIHPRGSDADGDGKTGESKKIPKEAWKHDADGDGTPDPVDKTETKKRAHDNSDESDCGCEDCKEGKSDCSGAKKAKYNASKRKKYYSSDSDSGGEEKHESEGVIRRMPKGSSKEFYVYHAGKKITFGDPHMANHNNDKDRRENFQARHRCSEQKDKSSAAYWACRVWRKGYRGPD